MAFLTALMARFAVLPALLGGVPSILAGLVRFLSTPLGQVVAAVAIAGGMFVWGDLHRARVDAAWHHAEVLRLTEASQHRQQERDAEAKAEATRDVTARLRTIEKLNVDLQGKVNEYEKTLSVSNACALTPADVLKLRKF